MKQEIENVLQGLIGLPIWAGGRASTLGWLLIGARRIYVDLGGEQREVGEYALHMQCSWRLVETNRIITGTSEYFVAAEPPHRELTETEWQESGTSRFDSLISGFFEEHSNDSLLIEDVWADSFGGFRLTLTDGYAIEAFPDTSLPNELWRLLPFDAHHFVVTGLGIEDDEEL